MRRRVCLVYPHPATFVDTDRKILSEAYEVEPFEYHGRRDLIALARAIRRADLSYSWFALGHATASVLLSRRFGKRSVVVVGGWDVVAMPELGYGAMLSPGRRRKTIRALGRADLVLAVSESNRREALQWVRREIPVIYHGIDTEAFRPAKSKTDEVVTVASMSYEGVLRRKGVDRFLEAARNLPEVPFTLVGRMDPAAEATVRRALPSNVTVAGWVAPSALAGIYARARVYAQLSAHEGFGVSVAEAMACECVPVVSNRGALPEVVNGVGLTVPYGNAEAAVGAIRQALRWDGAPARVRVLETFSFAQRRERLLATLEGLL